MIKARYSLEQLKAEIRKVVLARAKGEEVSLDHLEELLIDADMYLRLPVERPN